MFVLGLQGSPRKKGNSDYLLTEFLKICEEQGARIRVIHMDSLDIQPCKELIVCEKKGFCPLKDEMEPHIYGLIRRADVVVLASPVFFYNVSAQAKILIDRCQMFWGRKYKLKLADPDAGSRQGVLLSAAASGGKRLFEGVALTAHYFFDAISAKFAESLTYKKVESAGAVAQVPGVDTDIREAAGRVMAAVQNKPVLVFVSAKNACRTQMAAAFAKKAAKGDIRVLCAGTHPAEDIDPLALNFMAQQGIDIKYRLPEALDTLMDEEFTNNLPVCAVCLEPDITPIPKVKTLFWDLPEVRDADHAALVGKEIQARVDDLVSGIKKDMVANR
ncbi:MAG: NAD(P)H-dependent oxidoreductase [Desulfotignum sp.]